MTAGLLCPSAALAQEAAPIELDWEAPPGCPSADTVLARVREIAGKTRAGATPLKAEALVTQRDGQYRMRLIIRSGDLVGARDLDGRSCSDLVGATAVALALLLSSDDPLDERALGDPASAPADVIPDKPPVPAAATPAEVSAPPPPPARRWRGLLTLPIAAVSVGPQRRPVGGLGLAAGVSVDRWRFRAEGKLWASQTVTTARQSDESGAELDRFTLSMRGCRNLAGSRLEIAPCALLSVQHLSARGTGPHIAPRSPQATWVAAGVGLQARVLLVPWLSLVAAVDGEAQLSRPEVKLDGVGLVERLSPFAATVSVGPEWIL